MKLHDDILEQLHKSILEQRGYVVEARVGRGGEAYVYRAIQAGHGKCAIKVHTQEVENPAELPRHLQEGLDVAVELRESPYFVTLFTWFVEKGVLFTVWQLSTGTLRNLLDARLASGQGPLTRDECCHYLHNVASGLDELHSRSGVHGDIKPENLLIFGKDVVKIGDLGISRLITSLTTRHTDVRSHLYSLPKQHVGSPTRERDIFAFAATYVELRLGRHAYGTTIDTITRNLIDNQPQLDGLDDDEVQLVRQFLFQDERQPPESSLTAWLEKHTKRTRPQPIASIVPDSTETTPQQSSAPPEPQKMPQLVEVNKQVNALERASRESSDAQGTVSPDLTRNPNPNSKPKHATQPAQSHLNTEKNLLPQASPTPLRTRSTQSITGETSRHVSLSSRFAAVNFVLFLIAVTVTILTPTVSSSEPGGWPLLTLATIYSSVLAPVIILLLSGFRRAGIGYAILMFLYGVYGWYWISNHQIALAGTPMMQILLVSFYSLQTFTSLGVALSGSANRRSLGGVLTAVSLFLSLAHPLIPTITKGVWEGDIDGRHRYSLLDCNLDYWSGGTSQPLKFIHEGSGANYNLLLAGAGIFNCYGGRLSKPRSLAVEEHVAPDVNLSELEFSDLDFSSHSELVGVRTSANPYQRSNIGVGYPVDLVRLSVPFQLEDKFRIYDTTQISVAQSSGQLPLPEGATAVTALPCPALVSGRHSLVFLGDRILNVKWSHLVNEETTVLPVPLHYGTNQTNSEVPAGLKVDGSRALFARSDGMLVVACKDLSDQHWMCRFDTESGAMNGIEPGALLIQACQDGDHFVAFEASATDGAGGTVVVRKFGAKDIVWSRMSESPVTAITISSDGGLVAFGDAQGKIEVWNITENSLVLKKSSGFMLYGAAVQKMQFFREHSFQQDFLAVIQGVLPEQSGKSIVIWNLPAMRPILPNSEDTPAPLSGQLPADVVKMPETLVGLSDAQKQEVELVFGQLFQGPKSLIQKNRNAPWEIHWLWFSKAAEDYEKVAGEHAAMTAATGAHLDDSEVVMKKAELDQAQAELSLAWASIHEADKRERESIRKLNEQLGEGVDTGASIAMKAELLGFTDLLSRVPEPADKITPAEIVAMRTQYIILLGLRKARVEAYPLGPTEK